MSPGQPSEQVAGAAPAARTSTSAPELLLSRRGSKVSLEISAVLETTPFGAPPLTKKLRVMVATEPLAQLGFVPGKLQSTMPPLCAQVKAEVVIAGGAKAILGGTAIVTCTFTAGSGPALLSQRKEPVVAPG